MQNDLVTQAKRYAIAAHGDQKYGDEFPYAIHLQAVESVLLRFGVLDAELRAAAWLHDVLEDTDRKYEEMVMFFGYAVADIVAALTEPKGGNRKWRHEQTYPRTARHEQAVIVKLADRIANIESGGGKASMYLKEYNEFKIALQAHQFSFSTHGQQIIRQMWDHLNGLMIELATRHPKYAHVGQPVEAP